MSNDNLKELPKLSKDVAIDLIPIYLTDDASDDSRKIVEHFASQDDDIASMLKSDTCLDADLSSSISLTEIESSERLKSKTITSVHNKLRLKMLKVALLTIVLLMIPAIAMNFSSEVNWDAIDFIVMGTMMMICGTSYVVIANASQQQSYKLGCGVLILTVFLQIWMNLAVGIIGDSGNSYNLLFLIVLGVVVAGTIKSKGTAQGLKKTCFAAVASQIFIFLICVVLLPPTTELESLMIFSLFFCGMFLMAAYLFKKSKN